MKLSEFLRVINYEITLSEKYKWECFGNRAQSITFWNGLSSEKGIDISCVYDLVTQRVYSVETWDHENHIVYCWIDPAYRNAFFQEAKDRGVSPALGSLDFGVSEEIFAEEDILDICSVEFNKNKASESYTDIEVDLPEDLLLQAMLEAHKQDITFNEFARQALAAMMEKHND